MKDISIVKDAIIPLLEKFAQKEGGEASKSGVSELGRKISGTSKSGKEVLMNNGERFPFNGNDRYLYNLYNDTEKESRQNRKVDEVFINSIAEYLGYEDIHDYLVKEGYIDKETNERIITKSLERLLSRNPPHLNEWFDKYILGARIVPALVATSSIPVVLFALAVEYLIFSNLSLVFIGIFFSALAYSIAAWNSERGKNFEKKYFHSTGKSGFPTTYLMLYFSKSNYTENQKKEYRQNISAYFNLDLLSEEQEKKNTNRAKELLDQAGTKVKVNVKSNIIRSANIKYGLIRNLIPATLTASILSVVCLLLGLLLSDSFILICFSIITPILILAHFQLRFGSSLKNAAEAYAIYLLDEFLSR